MSLFSRLGKRPPTAEEWRTARQEALDEIEESLGSGHTSLFRERAAHAENNPDRARELIDRLEKLVRYARAQVSNINDSMKPGADLAEFREAVTETKKERPTS